MKIAVLASGRGSNFKKLVEAVKDGKIKAEISILITDREAAKAADIAREFNINVCYLPFKKFPDRDAYDRKIVSILKQEDISLVCLAGYMRIVTPTLIKAFKNRIMNIHPSLLPAFPGLGVHKKVLEYGAKFSGATVHFVDTGVDTGPIIIQAVVPVKPEDTPESLAERILKWEHKIYPQAVKWFTEDRIKIDGRIVTVEKASYDSLPVIPSLEDF
ncbi:phosphoribosylglycinamide formyltransferase [Desulfurobacterium indicum]|uniref:Phosphoribosylglycinamide formyltransferase n=1 Tax=Desulfurobacterium indicum TaxID=1914305 RepID=A0A1R1MK70_9BACT|nr:phosphoribosylglycinamide formyltransferase [Desulfurobacterium indicum]OMH40100.1 phosphoribosylglycinamide formyltransferase [Desulfurobacterium indicum]